MIPIKTPLGQLETGLIILDRPLPPQWLEPAFGSAVMFEDGAVRTECLVEAFEPELPDGMSILACERVRWTIRALGDTPPLSVAWTWRPGHGWTDGGANSGQYFDAMTYNNERYEATIATRDGDWLANSAKDGEYVPSRFEEDIDQFYMLQWVKYRKEGFRIDVPALIKGESVTVFLSVAWNARRRDDAEDDISSWFAADLALLW